MWGGIYLGGPRISTATPCGTYRLRWIPQRAAFSLQWHIVPRKGTHAPDSAGRVPAREGTMRITTRGWVRESAFLLLFCASLALLAAAQDSLPPPQLPDSPGASVPRKPVAGPFQAQLTAPVQPSAPQPDSTAMQKPVGTAAAEKPVTTGVAASNPSGEAVAPGKQRRTRTLLIKVGAIVGAGVAVGTVAALSSASPSRPPGSR